MIIDEEAMLKSPGFLAVKRSKTRGHALDLYSVDGSEENAHIDRCRTHIAVV